MAYKSSDPIYKWLMVTLQTQAIPVMDMGLHTDTRAGTCGHSQFLGFPGDRPRAFAFVFIMFLH